jgi:antitoxin ParD1/3/4
MELTITPELESLIQRKLNSGKYETPQQVIESALSRLDEKDVDLGMSTAEFQALIDEGWNEAERGETISGEEARSRLVANRAARQRG